MSSPTTPRTSLKQETSGILLFLLGFVEEVFILLGFSLLPASVHLLTGDEPSVLYFGSYGLIMAFAMSSMDGKYLGRFGANWIVYVKIILLLSLRIVLVLEHLPLDSMLENVGESGWGSLSLRDFVSCYVKAVGQSVSFRLLVFSVFGAFFLLLRVGKWLQRRLDEDDF